MLTVGLRPGEALALKWSDLDGDRLTVQPACVRGGKIGPTKTGKRGVVSLDSRTIAALKAHRVRQAEWRLQAGDSFKDQA